jgi:hypothetical protein
MSGKPAVGLPDTSGLQIAAPPGSPLVHRKVYGTPKSAGLQIGAVVSRLPVCL